MQPVEFLRETAGYADRPREFDEVIEILDSERRLITPTDSARLEPSDEKNATSRYYQLTHDYLVPSLRTWLTRKQTERLRGRAELRLSDIAADWAVKPNKNRLPAVWEYVGIRLLTSSASWNPDERKVMSAAARFHGKRWTVTLAAIALLGVATWNFLSRERDEHLRQQAELLVNAALGAPAEAVPYAARNVEPSRRYALPFLRRRFEDTSAPAAERLHAAVLLTRFGEPKIEYLIDQIESAERHECPNVVAALRTCGDAVFEPLHKSIQRAESQKNWRFKARLAFTLLELGEAGAASAMLQLEADPIQRVTFIDTVPQWFASVPNVLERVDPSDSGAFRSGLVLGIGSIASDALPPAELDAAALKLAQWHHALPDAGTHSATGWALRSWRRPLPDPDSSSDTAKDWHVNSVGMTMVKVPPIDSPRKQTAASRQSRAKSD